MAEQSGDRQRREKGPPILTAEKGEHERAPSVGEIYLSPVRATVRAPPPKWAINAFFPECRAAGFLWYFLSLRKKVLPPSGRQPHRPRRSRRVNPPGGGRRFAPAGAPKGFPLALWKPSSTESRRETHKTASPNSRRSRRAKPQTDFFTAKLAYTAACRGLSARPLHPFGPPRCIATKSLRLRARGSFPQGKPLAHRSPLMEKFVSPIPFSPKEVFPP